MSFVSDYLSFTKKERHGIIVLVVFILVFLFLPLLFPYLIKKEKYDYSDFEKQIAGLKLLAKDSSKNYTAVNDYGNDRPAFQHKYDNERINAVLFEFDPNTLTALEWKRLGLRDKTIATIQNYLNKGGRFYKPEDIGKIWGLHNDEVQRLMPYVRIAAKEPNRSFEKEGAVEKKQYVKEVKLIDVNSADSSELVELPGIGAGFAKRIIKFREKLGGFVSIDQIGETYGLPDSTFQKIKPRLSNNNLPVRQFNINTVSVDELKQHPYIRYHIANAIIQYRIQHGNFSSVDDIRKIMLITDDVFNKIAPYLKTIT